VVESQRGRGVGRALLDAAERAAADAGARALELVTAEANLAALELFLKSDYRIVRTLPSFYPRGQTAHVLRKTLT
jgi:ribosomal protein S18 acetylase RimI-like enzyme